MEELIAFSPLTRDSCGNYDAKPADAGFGADWYDAVGFCRWLGQQSGLSEGDQSYAAPETLDKAKYPREPNPDGELGPAELAAGAGSTGISIADGIGVGSGQPCRSADGIRLWQRREPAGAIWLVRGEQRQARPSAAGIASEHSWLV